MMKKHPHKKARTLSPPRHDLVGCRIRHTWRDSSGNTVWTGTVLEQVAVNPSLYLIKYDTFDCIYGLELHKDPRIQDLVVLPGRPASARRTGSAQAEALVGQVVEHQFETEPGPGEAWRGVVLARAPVVTNWFYITYEKDPVLYMYALLDDYKQGDLRVLPQPDDGASAGAGSGDVTAALVGKKVEYAREEEEGGKRGGTRSGLVIHQVAAKPSVYFIKFDDDFLVYVYDLVSTP